MAKTFHLLAFYNSFGSMLNLFQFPPSVPVDFAENCSKGMFPR